MSGSYICVRVQTFIKSLCASVISDNTHSPSNAFLRITTIVVGGLMMMMMINNL